MGTAIGRGWRSTKLHLSLITMTIITTVYALAGFPEGQFSEFCIAIITAAGIYSGARAAEAFAARGQNEAHPPPPV